MFLVLWEFEVKPGYEKQFEKVYGPDGDWARLFRTDPHYHQTRLLRDPFHSAFYLTLDFWDNRESYEQFRAGHQVAYKAIDALAAQLTVTEKRMGWFEKDAE
jgi:heme-degrading monooxygenase HmoA